METTAEQHRQTILVVEDDPSISTLIRYNLEQAGYLTLTAMDGLVALELAVEQQPDLILLDVMLPGMDGTDVCLHLRRQQIDIPIIMLTALSDEHDKVIGLETGADDYMTKPFSPRELTARVKAVLRRTAGRSPLDSTITLNGITVYPGRYRTERDGEPLDFTPKEFELLVYLMKNKNRVVSRDQLLQEVWNYDFNGDTRIIDVHISRLREKIEEDTKNPMSIKTLRGIGYRFEESL